MKGCLVEKQAETAGVNKSGDLILGDYLIYWLCGEVWLTELQLFKCSLGGNILLGWTCWLFACRRTGHRRKQKNLGWSQHPELCREVSSSLVRADVLSHTVVVPVRQIQPSLKVLVRGTLGRASGLSSVPQGQCRTQLCPGQSHGLSSAHRHGACLIPWPSPGHRAANVLQRDTWRYPSAS